MKSFNDKQDAQYSISVTTAWCPWLVWYSPKEDVLFLLKDEGYGFFEMYHPEYDRNRLAEETIDWSKIEFVGEFG